jgi:hypothetical protein
VAFDGCWCTIALPCKKLRVDGKKRRDRFLKSKCVDGQRLAGLITLCPKEVTCRKADEHTYVATSRKKSLHSHYSGTSLTDQPSPRRIHCSTMVAMADHRPLIYARIHHCRPYLRVSGSAVMYLLSNTSSF